MNYPTIIQNPLLRRPSQNNPIESSKATFEPTI